MLSCMLENGNGFVGFRGNIQDLMADTTFLIKRVYEQLGEDSPDNAELFKKFMKELLIDLPFYSEEEMEKRVEGFAKEMLNKKEDLKKALSEIQDMLDRLDDGDSK